MTEVSRRTLLAGTAGMAGAIAGGLGGAAAQTPAQHRPTDHGL